LEVYARRLFLLTFEHRFRYFFAMLATVPMPLEPAPDEALRDRSSPWSADERAVRLARRKASARRELGRIAARFMSIGGHHRLGFSSVGDYSRERLGISGRELQSFAFVASRLERLPLVGRAFARGEVSWSQVRLLAAIADAESEESWLARARGRTVRELVIEIRRSSGAAVGAELEEALDDESDSTEGEGRVRFSLPCPARVALLWRRAIELARRMLGWQAPVWQAAEAIVAEASSAVPIDAEPTLCALPTRASMPRPTRAAVPRAEERQRFARLESLDAFGLDRTMRELLALLHSIDVDLGALLRRFLDLRIHRALGFDSFDGYVRERLGISPAKARALVMVERRTRETRAFADAYRSGSLSWVRALAILPVVDDPSHAAQWVVRAGEVMVRRLQDEVEWALDMRDVHGRPAAPPEADAELATPDLQTCARADGELADRRVTFFAPASVAALFRAGASSLSIRGEPMWKGFERLLLHAIAEWEAQPRHRDPIFARDRWRCSTPGCSRRRNLQDHHLDYRSRGGGNEQWNRTAVCAPHHLHAVHMNVVAASGRAPHDIVWELGLRAGRAPLLRVRGERYLPVS
jgi:hypothetical protein